MADASTSAPLERTAEKTAEKAAERTSAPPDASASAPDSTPAPPTAASTAVPAAAGIPNLASLRDRIPKLEPRGKKADRANPTPVPETPPLPPPPEPGALERFEFRTPVRRIITPKDHALFLASPTYRLLLAFVFGLAEAAVDTPISAVTDDDLSPAVKTILSVLDEALDLCRDTPPDEHEGSRFGNKAFRDFLDKVGRRTGAWHERLGVAPAAAAAEAGEYLRASFGSRRRIDYGSGHELNFAVWLLCLYQLSVLGRADLRGLALRVFPHYLDAMRTVQLAYYLEPAGSHGVWGLDDYQFLPFLLGAAQLLHHPFLTPRAVHQPLALEEAGRDYMYLGQVAFVNSTKTVRGLRWHSPMLDDISGARSWAKIDAGMRRMFAAEVLGKLPVMQHFMFGSLMPAPDGMTPEAHVRALGLGGEDSGGAEDEEEGGGRVEVYEEAGVRHVHAPTGWNDCCGIRVPSSVGAAEEMRKRGLGGEHLRTIPFD